MLIVVDLFYSSRLFRFLFTSNMLRSIFIVFLYFLRFTKSNVIDYDDWSVGENALFPTLPIAAPWSENRQCRKDSRLLMTHLKNKTFWAMQMWDASAKNDFGLLYGNVYQSGNFDECLLVKEPIKAQYCGVTVRASVNIPDDESDPFPLDPDPHSIVWKKFKDSRIDPSKWPRDNVTWGLCVPASCTRKDLNDSFNRYVQLLNSKSDTNHPKYTVSLSEEWHCTKQLDMEYSWSEILFWSFSAFLVVIQIIAMCFDFGVRNPGERNESKPKRLLMSFSIRRNLGHLFKMKYDTVQLRQLRILYGIKYLSVMFIVFDHRGGLVFASPIVNFQSYEKYTRSIENMFVLHGDLLVDTFFFISGLLAFYALLEVYNKKFVNPFLIVAGRWIRLAPLYYYMVWFHTDGILRLGSGPVWKGVMQPEVQKCKDNWWLNLLFFNNYFKVADSCMIHSWFISCEIHLFVICMGLAILSAKKEKLGVSILAVLIFVTTLLPGIITYSYRLKPLILFYHEFFMDPRSGDTWKLLYVPTHARAAVYFLGMMTGYIVFKTKTSSKKLPHNCGGPLLILALALLFAPMAYGSLYYDPRRPYDVIESSLFAILRRISWALGCFIVMMVNCFGRNVFLIEFGRARWFIFLSKLTYSVYLVHFYMQGAGLVAGRTPRYFSMYDIFVAGVGDVALSLLYGGILYLLIELPFKKFVHELIFAKVITRVKTKIEQKENRLQLESGNPPSNLETENVTTVRL